MPLNSLLRCVCDKCNREQIFDSWRAAKASAWRELTLEVVGGASVMSTRSEEPKPLHALLCGDCGGGLGVKVSPRPELVEG